MNANTPHICFQSSAGHRDSLSQDLLGSVREVYVVCGLMPRLCEHRQDPM